MVSSDIVGWQEVSIPTGWSMFTPTFTSLDGNMTLGDIQVLSCERKTFTDNTADGVNGRSRNRVTLRKIYNASSMLGDYTENMIRYSSQSGAWSSPNQVLESGEGYIVNNQQGTNVYFRFSGKVDVSPLINIPTGWSIVGNYTPVDITLNDITVLSCEMKSFTDQTADGVNGRSRNRVTVREIYNDSSHLGEYTETMLRYTSQGSKWNGEKTIKAGMAFIINNQQGTNVYFKIKSPVTSD